MVSYVSAEPVSPFLSSNAVYKRAAFFSLMALQGINIAVWVHMHISEGNARSHPAISHANVTTGSSPG